MRWDDLVTIARAVVAKTISSLPTDLRERVAALPITYEHAPSRALLRDGIEPDTLGLFVGGEFVNEDHVPIPAQIILFLDNIWDMVEADEKDFRSEVRITLMHELGHYLGLDEDGLDERGLS